MQDVVVGYLHGDHVTQEFHHCLFRSWVHDLWGPHRILDFAPQYSSSNLCRSRNQMVLDMLDHETAEWLWMLDTDATFQPDMLDQLLTVADPTDRPIIGALCHQVRGKLDSDGNAVIDRHYSQVREVIPTIYQMIETDGVITGYRESTSYGTGLLEVDATGCHCLLVHRTVFEKIESDHPYRWFREDLIGPGVIAGEDIWFCLQARQHGFPVYVDTRLESGHVKRFVTTSDMSTVERTA